MTEDLTSHAGQISVVTGAASGIGRASAILLARRGAHVIALDVNESGLKSVVDEVKVVGAAPHTTSLIWALRKMFAQRLRLLRKSTAELIQW